jgi:hypothetical protein
MQCVCTGKGGIEGAGLTVIWGAIVHCPRVGNYSKGQGCLLHTKNCTASPPPGTPVLPPRPPLRPPPPPSQASAAAGGAPGGDEGHGPVGAAPCAVAGGAGGHPGPSS